MRLARIVSPVVAFGLASPLMAASPSASGLRAQGNEHEYNLRLDPALSRFRQAVDVDPRDPASYRAIAATYLMRIAFRRGAVTADDFMGGEVSADTLEMPKPPSDLALGFRSNAERALHLAEQQVQARPNDADAHFQLGAAIALLASYSATIDGQVFAAFKLARRAYQEHSRALEIDPQRQDAGLIVGVYQYIVSTRSLPMRWLARVSGLDSDKARGIALIEAAARYRGENQTDAQLALAMIYNRERLYEKALSILSDLQARYPDNRLFWLEAGSTAIRAGQFQAAWRSLDGGLAKLAAASSLRAFGEEALWHYKRGASLVGLHRDAEAELDLRAALQQESRDWVHARAHTELGKLADLAGVRDAACQEYRVAVQLAKGANDSLGLEDAERWLARPYREHPEAVMSARSQQAAR
jgi:tetratricopeptide (TPR) repeat protein